MGKMPIYPAKLSSKMFSRVVKLKTGCCYWPFLFAFCLSLLIFNVIMGQNSVSAFNPTVPGSGQTGSGQTGVIPEKPITSPSGTGDEKLFTINIGAKDPNSQNPVTPKALVVKSGTTVTWMNKDNSAHRIASGSTEKGPTNVFYSDFFDSGENFTLITSAAGVYEFYDPIWSNIKGTLTVTP